MKILCLLSGHHRSRKAARRRGETWFSRCLHCDASMRRIGTHDWIICPSEQVLQSSGFSEPA